jgi:WD40 repeat protein
VTTGQDVQVYDGLRARLLARFVGHVGNVNDAAFAAGGAVVSIGDDGALRTWAPVHAILLAPSGTNLSDATTDLHLSADDRVVTEDGVGRVHRWDLATGRDRPAKRPRLANLARRAAGAPRIVTASFNGELTLYDTRSGRSEVMPVGPANPRALAIDPLGRYVAVAGGGSGILVAPVDGSRTRVLQRDKAPSSALAFNREGSQLAAAGTDGTTSLFDVRTGDLVRTLSGHAGAVTSVVYSADGARLVTAGEDGTVRISPVRGGPAVVLYGYVGAVRTANLNAAGDRVVTAGRDGFIRLWDAAGGPALAVVDRYDDAQAANFSRDGTHIVSAGIDASSAKEGLRVIPCEVCGSFASVLRLAESRADRPLTASDRRQLVPGDR